MSVNTSVVYKPRGRAGEYSDLAVNLYNGCSHFCVYCYVPACLHTTREKFHAPLPRKNILEQLTLDAQKLKLAHEKRSILLCFTCDPYQPINQKYQLARKAIQILHSNDLNVMILTKGGKRAEQDFELLASKDWFGVTLTSLDKRISQFWEPGAALPGEVTVSDLSVLS